MANKYLNDTGLGHFWDKTAYKYGVEYIVGTQSAATNVWTGVTLDKNCVNGTIPTGKVIVYHLPYAGNSSAATLNLTFPDGTTSGAKNVYRLTGSTIGTNFGAGCDLFLVFNGSQWKVSAYQDTDSNNYDRMRHYTAVKAASAVTAGQIIVGTDAGYKPVANGVTFSINYPILYAGSAISAAATNNNTYDAYPGVNLQSTKSGYTGTTYKMVFLVGTLSGTTFTVNSDIFTQTIPASVDNKVYAPIGLMTDSNKTVFFFPTNNYWEYRNGVFRPISSCPTLATVATSGSYNDLSNKPTIPAAQVQSNWTQTTTTAVDYIKNKPTLATVATSGSYNDLSNKPTIPAAQVNSDWNATSGKAQILNKPTLATVATSGSYNDLDNKPTIPTVNNATLTIQKNGSTVKTFTANASSNVTANITVPTNTNELTNGAGFITSSGSITGNAATATNATNDSDGNAINTTYLKKSGGAMTGAITRALASSGTIADTNLFTVTGSTDGFGVNYSSTTADVGITTLYTTDDANAKLSLGNKIGSTYKEAISIVNGSATVTGSVSGNAGTATKLETARTIGIGTGGTGTATSFNGTANITIPLTDVKDSYVTWGGKALTNVTPDDMGCVDEFGHNKLAFLPASCIKAEYTTNGGTTWIDYGLTDAQKIGLVTTMGPSITIGKGTVSAKNGTLTNENCGNYKARVTISTRDSNGSGKIYTSARKWLINYTTNGAGGCKVLIEQRTIANYNNNVDTWATVGTYDISGWSGWNSYPHNIAFGGGANQTSQIAEVRFTTYITSVNTTYDSTPSFLDFRLIGATNWATPSEMARAGRLYTVDTGQNATFPAEVITVGRIYPSADNTRDLGAGSKRWKDVYLSGALKNNTYTWSLPSKTGTVALTSDIPSVPTVNNGTLTIQKNGSNVQTFTANQSTNVTANITVPTKISDLTNTSGGFVTYCTCVTAAATAAKVVTLDSGDSNWVLRKGDIIAVKFTNTNTASSVTLNVNSTGAKSIWYNNAAYTGSSNAITGYANRYLFYLYDGTNWVWFSDGRHDGNDNTYTTAYCSTASATAAKGASMTGYVLTANRYTVITFTNANTYAGAVTLNINSRGAKPLYIDGKASSSTNYAFAAGSYIVWYDGTNYYLTTNGNIPRTLHSESGVSASTVTQTVTNDMIANGTIKFAKVDSTEFVKLTMSTTDISAGSALAKNTLYGVYT